MADPLSPLNAGLPDSLDSIVGDILGQPPTQQQDELDSILSQPSPALAQASQLMELRDNPKANDLLLGTATRFKEGKLPFNTQSWQDAQKNVNDYVKSTSQATLDAEKNNDWLGLTKIAVGGVGKVIGSYLQSGLGITNEDAKAMQESLASRNYIGTIKDSTQAAKALELGTLYSDELTAGKSIAPKDQAPAMEFGRGAWNTPKVGMNLARAQEYYKDLQSDKTKKLGTAGLRNFAIQSGDAFIPFVSVGDIIVDENDPDQVARRAALTNGINDVIQKDYMPSTLAGLATGSLGQFMSVGAGWTKLLGRSAEIAGQTIKVPTTLSKGATYAVVGASQSLDQDPRNLSVGQRLASIVSEAGVLALSEEAGNRLEDVADHALANHMVAKALQTKLPMFAPVVQGTAKLIGTTLGETSSDVIDAIARGQDPIAQIPESLAASGGIGLGMVLAEGFVGRRARLNQMANDKFADTLRQAVTGIKSDPKIPEDQKMQQIVELRESLNSPQAQALFDAVNVRASLDPRTAPETTAVADEAINNAKQGAIESMLSSKVAEAQAQVQPIQMGVPPTAETRAPESEEESLGALNELVNEFQKGVTSIDLSSTPANQAKIDWLESQGRVYGKLSEDGSRYQVLGVKDAEGNWIGKEDPAEIMQDEKDAILQEIENKPGITQAQIDEISDLLDTAGSMPEIEAIASKHLGPSQIQTALETRLAQQQELVAEERPAEFRAKKIADQITALQTKIRQSPLEETPALEEQLAKLQAMQGQGELERGARGEQSVASLIGQFERETNAGIKSGAISPEPEARPDVILAINNPEQASYQKFQKLAPDPRENDVNALGDVFNLKNPSTVELLQSLGAIDENGRNTMTPAETLMAYIKRKNTYLQSKSLAGYQKYNIADEVSNGTINSFLYELRQGKSNLSLSTIFNSRLRDFIRQAVPRMRAGVGIGAAVSMETPGLRTQAVDAETLAEEQGLNPAVAGAINETLDQIDATETDFQMEGQAEVPSAAQRQEALAILAENFKQPFRNSLATDAEKLAFDAVVGDVKNIASEAAKIGTTIDNINALQPAVRTKFIQGLENNYRNSQRAGTLPVRAVEEPAGVVREGNLTANQIKPYVDRFRQLQADNFFDDAELVAAKTLLGEVQASRSGDLLRSFNNFIESVAASKLTPDSITELTEAIDTNLRQSTEDGTISQKQADAYVATLNKLAEPYLASETMPEGEAKNKIAATFRSNLLRVSDQILRDSGLTINEEGIYEQPEQLPTPRPEAKTPADRREEARAKLAELEAKRTTTAKRVPEKAVPAERKEVERPVERPPAGVGRPGVERPRGTPIPKSFVEPRNQLGKSFSEKILAPAGQQVLSNLSKEQAQDVAAAVTTIENSKHKAFYLANGPGTGKTRVLLGAGAYYLNKGFKVVYITAPDAVTPNWDYGEIGGSIQKDAAILGVPLAVRGGKGENGKGLPIEFVPGRMLVTTYNSGYLEKLLPLIDDKTVVLLDEQHSGRNLSKAIQGGKTRSWAVLMDDIANKAGRTLMASGTPFETPDQLLSLGRLGIFDNESPEALFSRLGFQKYSLRGGKKYYWQLAEGVTETEMQDRLETYLDGMAKNGIMRSRSLKLDGVDVEFQDVPLDNQIKQQLEDIKAMYGGTQNVDISALRKMAAAQKRALEEYKVDAAAKRAVDAIKRGKKPVLYVGFVSDENSKGETVNPTSASLEAAIAKLDPTLKIARMYTGSEQTKEQAMASFNEGDADVLIATKEMGGTGIELDDKFGDESREMIVLSPPISAIQAVQLIYRVWRVDSASRPNIVFLESQAEIDQNTIGRMRAKLRLLDATVGAGFEGLKAEEPTTKPVETRRTEKTYLESLPIPDSYWNLAPASKEREDIVTMYDVAFDLMFEINDPAGRTNEEIVEVKNWLKKNIPGYYEHHSRSQKPENVAKAGEYLNRVYRTVRPQMKPTEVVAPVKSTVEATPEQVSSTEEILKSALGKDYNNNVITFRDAKGQSHNYNIKIDPNFTHSMAVVVGSDNDSDTIVINPTLLEKGRNALAPDAYKSYITQALLEETIHMETLRYYRELGLDPIEELTAIGDSLSQASKLAIGRLYYSSLGSDITNPSVQAQIKALSNNSYLVAMEGIRQLSQLKLTGGITEQVSSINANDIARATQRLKDILKSENKSVLARLGVWFDSMATVVKRGLGLAPNAKDRLVMRQSIEDAISNLRKTSKYFTEASAPGPVPAPEPGRSPTSPRPANKFDSYDLRVYRMIENHLEGRTDGVFGVTAADDLFKTVDVNDWLDGLDVAARRGMITNQERNLFRAATKSVMDGGRASLPGIANKALEIAEGMEESGESLPVAAFVATTEPVNLTEPSEYGKYNVKIGFYPSYPTTAKTAAGAVANTVAKMFEDRNEIIFDGRNYTYKNRGALIAAIGKAGYDNYARRLTPAPEALVPAPDIVNMEKRGELAFHGTRANEIPSLLQGVKANTNFSPNFGGQAFGADVVLVYPKNKMSFATKTYQNDLILSQESNAQPIAAMIDSGNFIETEARRSDVQVMEDITNLPEDQQNIAMELSAAIDTGDRKKASQIKNDLKGNPIGVQRQIEKMRLKQFNGKYYLPSGELLTTPLPKAQPKPNADTIIKLANELVGAPQEATQAVTAAQAIANVVNAIPQNIPVFSYQFSDAGDRITNVRNIRSPQPRLAPAPEIRESQAVKNIITKFADSLPEGKRKDQLLDAWYYMSVPREQQFEDARQYIGTYGFDNTLNAFLGGNIKSSLPLQGAIGFELAKGLGEKAKTDRFAREQLAEVMLLLSKKYGTEPGRTVDLWNALGELSTNPEAMKMYVGKQIDSAIKDRLVAYKPEENEIASGLVDAGRRAAEKITTSKKMQKTLDQLGKLVDLNKKGGTVSQIQAVLADYLASEDANKDGAEFLGADLTAAPEVGGGEADDIRLDPKQTRALGRIILELIQRSENPRETAASADEIKRLVMLVPALRDAKNQDNVRRKIELYFDASLTYALESYGARALRAARARETGIEEEVVAPPATRGEAIERAARAKARAAQEAPVVIPSDAPSKLAELAEASADALQKQASRLQQEPKVKDALEEFAARIRRLIAQRTKEMGGLQPAFEPEPKPTEAEVLKDRIAKYPDVQEFISNVRDSLRNNYKEEDLIGLEPFIEEAFGRPFAVSSLKQAVRSLESIGGPQTNIRSLIRSSRGDIMDFENKMGALLTQNTNLDEAQKKEVLDFLRDGMTELIAEERKKELENIKKKFEKKKERKTRKMRSALDKLIEATNLGVLTDSEVFMQMRSQLGLPELTEAERNKLNKMIENLPLYPVGMIRNRKISEMYQYIKLVSPQVWGELLVNYQTSNLLAGVGTIGINAWSATASNQLNAAILGSVGFVKGMVGDKARAKAYIDAARALNSAILIGEKPALKAAANIFFKGDYSSVQDALTQELGGVNIWEAIVSQAEAYRAKKPGAVKPELPVNILGEEYRIPLDSKFISSKYGALAPFIFFGRSMAAGDAINKISSKKMYEIAEATNIAIEKGLKSQEEIELEVARLLNQSPEARIRAEAKAAAEAKEFNLTPDQESLRVEEILEQGRPDEEEVKNLAEKAKTFAAQSTYTNNFEGWFGLLADGLTAMSSKAWPLRLVIKFLKTGSSLANEVLNFMPVTSTVRLYRGSAAMLKDTKYYRPPAVPGTVEHDLLVGKMTLGYILTAALIYGLKEAMSGEDDPYFMIHFKGPNDPAQREAFFAAGGKLRSLQVGRFKDGSPQFFSFEGFPVGISGPLILAGAIAESVRYDKRSKSEAIINGAITGGALAMYGIMDMAALSGIRQIMSLTSPGPGTKDAKGIMTNLTKTFGNVVGGLIPGYATLRDVEQVWNGFTGAPSARPYQNNFLSTFALSIPFASKVGQPDLDFLGGNVRTQLANTVPFVRRLTTSGVDSVSYDEGKRTPQAIHDKLISMFASNRFSLSWDAGTLKDFAMQELIAQKEANKEPITYDDFYQLKRELTTDEKYEWMQRAGPIIQEQLGARIPQLEKMSRAEFMTIVPMIVNPIKKAILYQVLLEKNQEGILFPERK